MTQKRDFPTPAGNAFAAMIDDSAATDAATRLYQAHETGMRFCCDSGERITPEEARIRDARDAARRGQPVQETQAGDHEELSSYEATFPRSHADSDEDFDVELDLDENYEIDLDELDISAVDEDEIGALELLN